MTSECTVCVFADNVMSAEYRYPFNILTPIR